MKKRNDIKIEVYEYGDYFVEIQETKDGYEAYYQRKDGDVKEFMFGCPKKQQTKKEFIEIVLANLDDYVYIRTRKRRLI